MTVTVLAGEVVSGRRLTQVPVVSASWAVEHRGDGSIEVGIPLAAEALQTLDRTSWGLYPSPDLFMPFYPTPEAAVYEPSGRIRPEFIASLDPWRCFLAVLVDDVVVEAGPIQPHSYDPASQVLTVRATGMRSVFGRRLLVGPPASWPQGNAAMWSVTHSGLSLGTIAKRLVELSLSHPGGGLPIVLPAEETGVHTRTYHGYEQASFLDRLDELMGVENGPDVQFNPRLQEDRKGVEWEMRVGTNAAPMLTQPGADWTFDARAARGSVVGMAVQRDPSRVASRAFVAGQGMESSTLVEYASDPAMMAAGYPLLDTWQARSTVSERATLRAHAAADVRRSARPYSTWEATVRTDAYPRLGQYQVGDFARVWLSESDPYLSALLPQKMHRARIVRVSGGLSDEVRVAFAPTMDSR